MEDVLLKLLLGLLTFVSAMLGFMFKKMDSRMGKLEDNHSLILQDLPTNYVSKVEHRRATDIISENQASAYTRLEVAQFRMEENFRTELGKHDAKLDKILDDLKSKVDK